jgi:DNA repair exonuclease SbcCD ATPase subunit
MRLLRCQLQNVRLHGELDLAFSPRLTLIGGPNESGKSTLVEALHRALFLKASATGAPVEALQSRLHMGQPVVQLSFAARGDTWTLRKRFSGSSGQVSLQAEGSGNQLSGPAAEEQLAELVGVTETVGSKQATTVLPSRWAHLWVRQGASGENLLEGGKSHYDFDRLRLQLEQSGGAAVQQSAHDQIVEQRIGAALEENFTSRGIKKHSPLYQRHENLRDAEARMAQAQARLAEYESASEDLAGICDQLEQVQTVDLPALQQRQLVLAASVVEAARLDGAIQLAEQALVPIRLRHDTAVRDLQQLDAISAELGERQQRLAELQANAQGAQAREAELTAVLQQRRESWELLTRQRQTLEQRQQLLQRLVERASTADTLQRTATELEKQRQNANLRQELAQQLAALPAISKPELRQLRQLDQQLRDARTRLDAMAAGVKLLQADQPVRLDGQPLQVGAQHRLSSVFQLQVGDGVVLEIAPGGGQALEELERTVQSATEQRNARLASFGAANLEAAETLLEQRSALEQRLQALGSDTDAQLAKLERQHSGLEERLGELDSSLEPFHSIREALEQEQALPLALAELQALQQEISRTTRHTSSAAQQAEQELDAAREALAAFQQQRLSEAGQLKVVQGELADRQQRLEVLISQQGDRQHQQVQLEALSAERQTAEAALAQLQAQRASLGSQEAERQQQQLQEQIEALKGAMEQLLDQRGAAKQRCDAISSEDPYATVEQARLQLETAEADHRQLLRLTEAHQMLQKLFQKAQADLSSRYSEPLAQAIGTYLSPLVSDGPVARLNYDQGKGFHGLQLRRGQEYYGFEALSGGMREQLAAALRLSMADVLRHAHDGCLPLVFDDAFTNSDPERIDLVKRMLGTAVERGLQVILLTCDPDAYGSFADLVVELGGPSVS